MLIELIFQSSSRESHTNSPYPAYYNHNHSNSDSPQQINNPTFPPPAPVFSQHELGSPFTLPTSTAQYQYQQQSLPAHSSHLLHQLQSQPQNQPQNQNPTDFRCQFQNQQQQQQQQYHSEHQTSNATHLHGSHRQLSQLILPSDYSSNNSHSQSQSQSQYHQHELEVGEQVEEENTSPQSARSLAGSIRSIASEISIGAGSISGTSGSGFDDGSGGGGRRGSLSELGLERSYIEEDDWDVLSKE